MVFLCNDDDEKLENIFKNITCGGSRAICSDSGLPTVCSWVSGCHQVFKQNCYITTILFFKRLDSPISQTLSGECWVK